jgi:hypothetical protein
MRVVHPAEGNIAGVNDLFWYYGRYKSGTLPEAGGLNDQPDRLLEQMKVIEQTLAHCDEAERTPSKKAPAESPSAGTGGRSRPRPTR